MIRTILKPTESTLQLKLPENLVGKLIEIIAFEIKEEENIDINAHQKLKPSQLRGFLSKESSQAMQQEINRDREQWDTF